MINLFAMPTATPIGLFARYKAVRKKGDVRFASQRLHGKITKLGLSDFFIILLQSTKLDTFKKYYFSHTANFCDYLKSNFGLAGIALLSKRTTFHIQISSFTSVRRMTSDLILPDNPSKLKLSYTYVTHFRRWWGWFSMCLTIRNSLCNNNILLM